ncbi:MAG: hypothetical protein ACU826_09465 [Gammaproteobacteria bacterium]
MSKIETDKYHLQRHNTAVIWQKSPYESLLGINRFLFCVIFLTMTGVLLLGFLLLPKDEVIQTLQDSRPARAVHDIHKMNPVISDEINALKSQMIGLISGSIESKLRILEQNINSGKLSPSDAVLIFDLKNDFKILQSYAEVAQGKKAAIVKEATPLTGEQLFHEVSQLRILIYFTIASCGLMVAGLGGIWLQNRYMLEFDKIIKKTGTYGE